MKKIIEASTAVAIAAKLCKPQVMGVYPITPQTHIMERIAEFVYDGEFDAELIDVESEHSALSACLGAQAAGVRTFTATASQGLALMHEILFIVSGMRLPVVMAVANRSLSAPINIWCFDKNAEVLMADLTYRPIYKVKKGDLILGKDDRGNIVFTKVTRTFKRKTNNLINLKTDNFDLICTPEHKFYYHLSHSHWAPAKILKNKNLHWFGYGLEVNDEFKRGWLAGVNDGDGCFYHSHKNTCYNFRLKTRDKEIVETFIKWADYFKYPLRKNNYLEKEGYFIASLYITKLAKELKEFLDRGGNTDYCRGYLAGMYDTDGSGPFKVKQAVIYNNNEDIVKKVRSCLNKLSISHKQYVDKRSMNYHIKINNVPEFFIKCRPILDRKRKNLLRMTLKSVKSRLRINDVVPVNKSISVYNLETETRNYVVNGFLVHNCDHQDSISSRDSGWMQFYVESAQEAFDTVIMAYKIAENKKIMLPAMVCLDGFTLSHVYEPVDILSQKEVDSFLPKYNPEFYLNPNKPMTFGPISFPNTFMEFKEEQQEAMIDAIPLIKAVNDEFYKHFKRKYGNGLIETYKTKDADYAILTMGSLCGTTRVAVDELRKQNKKVGLIKIKAFRPFPFEDLISATKNLKGIAVIDKNISMGSGGALYTEVKAALSGKKTVVSPFIAGLGGRDVTREHIKKAVSQIGKTEKGVWLT